ncbi:MAG: alpha/beta hydrolase [Chloroflexi bacterium]|nr:alpha/beta hydrolase [Chloroflexota bacterium]
MAPFVIVHGAWGGAWSWNRLVVPRLRQAGQEVYAVTLTGLGERAHLATPDVDLDTHIQDVVNLLYFEDLTDVILAGHSYGGMVITGAADRAPERIRQLVYLDAATPSDGQASVDQFPGRREEIEERVQRDGDGWLIPPGPVPPDQPAEITAWATPRRRPQPVKTMTQPLRLTRGETALPRAYVYCTLGKAPDSPQAQRAGRVKNDPRWRFIELQTGHNLHYSAPDETVRILLDLAGQ